MDSVGGVSVAGQLGCVCSMWGVVQNHICSWERSLGTLGRWLEASCLGAWLRIGCDRAGTRSTILGRVRVTPVLSLLGTPRKDLLEYLHWRNAIGRRGGGAAAGGGAS